MGQYDSPVRDHRLHGVGTTRATEQTCEGSSGCASGRDSIWLWVKNLDLLSKPGTNHQKGIYPVRGNRKIQIRNTWSSVVPATW